MRIREYGYLIHDVSVYFVMAYWGNVDLVSHSRKY